MNRLQLSLMGSVALLAIGQPSWDRRVLRAPRPWALMGYLRPRSADGLQAGRPSRAWRGFQWNSSRSFADSWQRNPSARMNFRGLSSLNSKPCFWHIRIFD